MKLLPLLRMQVIVRMCLIKPYIFLFLCTQFLYCTFIQQINMDISQHKTIFKTQCLLQCKKEKIPYACSGVLSGYKAGSYSIGSILLCWALQTAIFEEKKLLLFIVLFHWTCFLSPILPCTHTHTHQTIHRSTFMFCILKFLNVIASWPTAKEGVRQRNDLKSISTGELTNTELLFIIYFFVLQAKVTLKNPSIKRRVDEAFMSGKKCMLLTSSVSISNK